jgi:hypothetical protein
VHATQPEWNANAIVCRGTDPTGHWRHHPRSVGNNVSVAAGKKFKAIGAN